ncbi:hypothetical protein NCS56_00530600 [Fusarium sp. Ph1]|nr:hypothetical protein NCS56_00530600 [Fusarium sp. Ph1]
MKEENVHLLKYREAKPSQGDASKPVSKLFSLENRTVLVTGATGYLGVTVTKAILESGGDVVCLDLVDQPPKKTWDEVLEVAERFSGSDFYFQCNIYDESRIASVFEQLPPLLKKPLHSLVSCAGVSDNGPATEFPVNSFRRLFDSDITAHTCHKYQTHAQVALDSFHSHLLSNGKGACNVDNKGVDTAGYNSSKAAVHQLTRSLAAEWGSRVNKPFFT